MGMKTKDYFNNEYAQKLAEKCAEKYPVLDKDNFILEISDHVEGKEYTQRLDAIVEVFGRYLPEYSKTLALFESMLGPRLPSFAVMCSEGIWLAPIGRYVEKNCADYPENFDLYKYDREKAQVIVDNWLNDNPAKETLRMIHHGTRSLRVKR